MTNSTNESTEPVMDGDLKFIVVFCDQCGDEFGADYKVRITDDRNTRLGYARAHMNTLGWRCDDSGDWCPVCDKAFTKERQGRFLTRGCEFASNHEHCLGRPTCGCACHNDGEA